MLLTHIAGESLPHSFGDLPPYEAHDGERSSGKVSVDKALVVNQRSLECCSIGVPGPHEVGRGKCKDSFRMNRKRFMEDLDKIKDSTKLGVRFTSDSGAE